MEIEAVTTIEELEGLRGEWERIAPETGEYYKSYDFHSTFLRYHASFLDFVVLCARTNGKLVAVAPFCITKEEYRGRSVRQIGFSGAPYTPVRGGAAEEGWGTDAGREFADYLIDRLNVAWDVFRSWDLVHEDPLTASFLEQMKKRRCYCESFEQASNYVLQLSSFTDTTNYYHSLSRKFRWTIRHGANQMSKDGSYCISLAPNDRAPEALELYNTIRQASWKEPERNEDFWKTFCLHLAETNRLRLFFLSYSPQRETRPQAQEPPFVPVLDHIPPGFQPVATNLYFLSGPTAYYLRTHYREDFAKFSPGAVLACRTLCWLLEKRQPTVDFQRGDEDYKRRFACEVKAILHCYLFLNPQHAVLNNTLRLWQNARSCLRPIKHTLQLHRQKSREAV